MRNKIIILLLIMLSTSFASAEFHFDNVKDYDVKEKKATIKNLFGLGKTYAEIKLLTPINVEVGQGYQKVAEFEISGFEDYENFLTEMEFINMGDGEEIIRNYDLKVKKEVEIIVDDYTNNCQELGCTETKIGEHYETRIVWEELTKKEIKKDDILIIGIFTNVQEGDYIDWIPEFMGVKIEEWATWTESLNTDIISYWKFDENTGTLAEDSVAPADYNLTGANTPGWSSSGKINNATDLDMASSEYWHNSDSDFLLKYDHGFTINTWVKPETTASNMFILSKAGNPTVNYGRYHLTLWNDDSDHFRYTAHDSTGTEKVATSTTSAVAGTWYMVTARYDGSGNMTIWINGSQEGSVSISDFRADGEAELRIGESSVTYAGGNYFDGIIDEVGVWNRSLTSDEISDLWNEGSGITYQQTEPEGLEVTLNSPENKYYSTSTSLDFNVTVTDNIKVANVSLYINEVLVETNSSEHNGTYIFSRTLSEGINNWSILAYDNESNSQQSSTRELIISDFNWYNGSVAYYDFEDSNTQASDKVGSLDLIAQGTPVFDVTGRVGNTIRFDANGERLNSTDPSYTNIDFGTTEDFTLNFWMRTNASGEDVSMFYTSSTTPWYTCAYDGYGYGNGTKDWVICGIANGGGEDRMYTWDASYNYADDEWYMVTFIRNNTGQDLYYYRNANLTIINLDQSPNNVLNDANADFFMIGTIQSDRYFQGLVDEFGIWNRSLTENEVELLYNQGSGATFGQGNLLGGSISLVQNSPENNFNTSNGEVTFNVTAEADYSLQNVSLYIDGVLNETNTSGLNGTYLFTKTLTAGSYNWNVEAYDTLGSSGSTSNRSLTILDVIENNQTYQENVLTKSVQDFYLNVSTLNPIVSSNFIYNGTSYSATITSYDDYKIVSYESLSIPTVSIVTNVSFSWSVTTTQGTTSIDSRNQTIKVIDVDNCSSYSQILYNFTVVNEKTEAELNSASSEVDLNIYASGTQNLVGDYSTSFSVSPFAICVDEEFTDSVEVDAQISYEATGYVKEFYYLQDDPITDSNQHENITLYSLDNDSSTTFKITYKDSSFLPVENALIQVGRKYVDEGVFKTVEQPITDADGQALVHLETEDVIYTFTIIINGAVDAVFNKVGVTCPNPLIDECEITLVNFQSYVNIDDYAKTTGVTFNIGYNDSTRTITVPFSLVSGGAEEITLNVTKFDSFGNVTLCTDVLTSSSGSLSCIIPNTFGNSSVIVELYKAGVIVGKSVIRLDDEPKELWGLNILMIGMLIIFSLVGISLVGEPMISLIGLVITTIILVALNVATSAGWIGAGATILYFIIGIIIVAVKGGNR